MLFMGGRRAFKRCGVNLNAGGVKAGQVKRWGVFKRGEVGGAG
jgi:hypothetical protein